ncbi:flagellar basal body-associated FliL family protein [Pelomonas sp. KK5]|uniref:flagellar basal body-associated FliL family protein n=1 Tax=Pelomonas sp. KK5 TaxID=1855730 RepID=UPI00097C18A1|nr:flagellar basal body-associated FliL family protein [Pelomonas sp. KK5]
MSKTKTLLLVAIVSLLLAGATGAAVWWALKPKAKPEEAQQVEAPKPGPDYRYVSLDKVLIMLRNQRGEAVTHYMAIDLVFKALPEHEKRTKDHLPLLRTVAVKALSNYTVEAATAMTVEQFADELNKAYGEAYAAEHREAPFAEALIGKLIIE